MLLEDILTQAHLGRTAGVRPFSGAATPRPQAVGVPQNVARKLTSIIFMIARRQPGLRQQAMALSAAGFLGKPFEADELMTAIQNALKTPGNSSGA